MLNKIWFALLLIGILYGFSKATYQTIFPPPAPQRAADDGKAVAEAPATDAQKSSAASAKTEEPNVGFAAMGERLTTATIDAAKTSVEICLGLVGFMALWLGLMNIAQDAGLVDAFARLLRPVMRLVFPEIPPGHPAQGAVLMNLSANMLGLNNAATPLGLKAMRELQELNPVKDTATNSMAMFLAINTSSVTIIPMTVIGFRVLTGSKNPAEPIAGTLVATLLSTIIAILITLWLSRWSAFRVNAAMPDANRRDAASSPDKDDAQ